MRYLSKRVLACEKSLQWFKDLHPNNLVLSNLFTIQWLGSRKGIIFHIVKVGEVQDELVLKQIEEDLAECEKFFRMFSFIIFRSTSLLLKVVEKIESRSWSQDEIQNNIFTDFLIYDGYGSRIDEFTREIFI
jgi:hypothetical protein